MPNFLNNIHPLLRRTKGKDEYSNTNYAVLNALDTILSETEEETIKAKVHSALHTASGKFLNYWGSWFGLSRRTNEKDADYRKRIIGRIDVPRGTQEAIRVAVKDALEDPYVKVIIYEPWENVFTLNGSLLGGDDHLLGNYYRTAVIDITVGSSFHQDLFKVIDSFKPAGTDIHIRIDPNLGSEDPNALPDRLPTIVLQSKNLNKAVTRTISHEDELRGTVRIGERTKDLQGEAFVSNFSELNSEDTLQGLHRERDFLHLISRGGGLFPRDSYTLADMVKLTEPMEKDYGEPLTLTSNKGLYTYLTYNLGDSLYLRHPEKALKRTKEAYSKYLEGSWLTLKTTTPVTGQVMVVEGYDFNQMRWRVLGSTKVLREGSVTNIQFEDIGSYLSDTIHLFLRVNSLEDITCHKAEITYRTDARSIKDTASGRHYRIHTEYVPTTVKTIDEYTGMVLSGEIGPDDYGLIYIVGESSRF